MSWRLSRFASPTGKRREKPGGQPQMSLSLSPRQEWARKRHRGGGGLAVPGPFKRIARAGGQKVTIRTAQRPLFEISSGLGKHFFGGGVTIGPTRYSGGKTGKST